MTLLFSSSSDVISRSLSPQLFEKQPLLDVLKLQDSYELLRCITWIRENSFTKVALQFPDSQLVDSVEIALSLEQETGAEVFILGDVTYGSCCVDGISAEHAGADCLIHFGPSCLSPLAQGTIPVLFVFGRSSLDCDVASEIVHNCRDLVESKCLLLFYQVEYGHAAHELGSLLKSFHPKVIISELNMPCESSATLSPFLQNRIIRCQRIIQLSVGTALSDCSVLFLGQEGLTQTNLIMNFRQNSFYTYDPISRVLSKDSTDVNRTLRRRFYIVERLKDASIIGILVGTLGTDKYLPMLGHLKMLIKSRGKRSYVLAVGKPNVAKLANFPEIQVFVLVACGENSFLDSKEFLAPIATPFELELALNSARTFDSAHYITDFAQLLPDGQNHIPLGAIEDSEEGDVSLVTGRLRSMNVKEDQAASSPSAVVIRNGMALATLHARAAGEHLSQRSWQGLEPQLGMTPVSLPKQGQSGLAAVYEGEG